MDKILKEIKTTILGIILLKIGIIYLLTIESPNVYLVGGLIVGGIGLILAPDRILNILFKKLNK